MILRHASSADRDAVYGVCLRTAASGSDASHLYVDGDLPGHVWAGPYLALEPGLAFVAEDDTGVAGYVLGAADTALFERRCEELWWPDLRQRYPEPVRSPTREWTADEVLQHRIHHPLTTPEDLVRRYPSHLHIDLLPRVQGTGTGRTLLTLLVDSLCERGSVGVHLGMSARNDRAHGFYRHLGFTQIQTPQPDDGTTVVMGLRLPVG